MSGHEWIEPDPYRETWLFLLLGVADSSPETLRDTSPAETSVTYWETAVANPSRMIERQAQHIRTPAIDSEQALLHELLTALEAYQFNETVLITPTADTLRVLRARLLTELDGDVTLRGFAHLAVDETLNEYFGTGLADHELNAPNQDPPQLSDRDDRMVEPSDTPARFYEWWKRIHRLVPAETLQGEPV